MAPLSRLAVGCALAASLALHGAALLWLAVSQDEAEPAMLEGGPGLEMAMVGDPFDALSAGTEAASDTAETIEPERAETVDALAPDETTSPEPAQTAELAAPAGRPEQANAETQPAKAAEIAAIEPEMAETSPIAETLEAMAPQPENVPQPTRRPSPPPRPKPQETRSAAQSKPAPRKEKAAARQSRAQTREARTGNRGASSANARRASQQSGTSRSAGSRGSGVGAAQAASNYSGQVLARIRRAQRYPSAARRSRAQGAATVAFTVSAGGGASRIRLAGSSGNALLDRAAIDTVRRASPFPPIPREAGRRSMSFTVPIRFQMR